MLNIGESERKNIYLYNTYNNITTNLGGEFMKNIDEDTENKLLLEVDDDNLLLKTATEMKQVADKKNNELIDRSKEVKKIIADIEKFIETSAGNGRYSTVYLSKWKCSDEIADIVQEHLEVAGYRVEISKFDENTFTFTFNITWG